MSSDPKPCGSCLHCAGNAFCPIVVSQRIFHYQIATSMTGLCRSDRPSVNCGFDMIGSGIISYRTTQRAIAQIDLTLAFWYVPTPCPG
jgi:hypothetical protein